MRSSLAAITCMASSPEDVANLSKMIPKDDRQTIFQIMDFHGPVDLVNGIMASTPHAWTARIGHEIAGMFGVIPIPCPQKYRMGYPWLVGSPVLRRNGFRVARIAPTWIEPLGRGFDFLAGFVAADRPDHARFAEYMGFTVDDMVVRMGPQQAEHFQFWKEVR